MDRRLILQRHQDAPFSSSLFRRTVTRTYAGLPSVSTGYPPLQGRSSTCYSPVRHCPPDPKARLLVRLACLKHAASVHSEPGSNSPSYFKTITQKMSYRSVHLSITQAPSEPLPLPSLFKEQHTNPCGQSNHPLPSVQTKIYRK